MAQKWNLQDIKPVAPRKPRREPPEELREREVKQVSREEAPEVASIAVKNGKKKKRLSTGVIIVSVVVVFMLGIAASTFMRGAELVTYPQFREPNVNASFDAVANAADAELPYEIMTLEAQGERQVEASGEEEVVTQAEGTIEIANNFSSSPVRLVTNTRFETEDGRIYRIKDSAVVPGYSTNSAGEQVPGTIMADVFADEAGEDYNLDEGANFTIPGFAGMPEFDGVRAEAVTPISGGYNGPKFIIADAELQTAQQALRTELRNSLLERINSEKPGGFVVFENATTFTYESLPSVEYGENLVTIKEKVYLRIPLFPEADFAKFIAAATVPGYEGKPVRITNTDVLAFDYTIATTSASNIATLDSLEFKLVGRPQIVWEYDADQLKADLVGKNRTALSSVLGAYPAIERAEATIRPFWKKTFPLSLEEIEIIEIIEGNTE